MSVVIETTIGDITVDLFLEDRPTTCKNFLKLCKVKYYNFCLFHSIQTDFIAQTGDPSGSGNGGESIFGLVNGPESRYYKGEKLPRIRPDKPGLLSMVNCGDNMLGSQFFITLGQQYNSLDEHVIFAEVVEGFDILLKLNETICDADHRPYQDIRITHTVILDDPFDDIDGLVVLDRSPEPSKEVLYSSRIGADEEIDDCVGCTTKEINEIKAQQEAAAQATILEIVGDLPDKDIAPPENVLFVCKLNPVTTEEDLDIIFSRFGTIKSCEVIRDKVSGDSLQYAFIEFTDRKSCEDAYLKMDNVLIDDRRIHVDFSQSVAKIRWEGKGRIKYLDKNERKQTLSHKTGYKKVRENTKYVKEHKMRSYNKETSTSDQSEESVHNQDYRKSYKQSGHKNNRDKRPKELSDNYRSEKYGGGKMKSKKHDREYEKKYNSKKPLIQVDYQRDVKKRKKNYVQELYKTKHKDVEKHKNRSRTKNSPVSSSDHEEEYNKSKYGKKRKKKSCAKKSSSSNEEEEYNRNKRYEKKYKDSRHEKEPYKYRNYGEREKVSELCRNEKYGEKINRSNFNKKYDSRSNSRKKRSSS